MRVAFWWEGAPLSLGDLQKEPPEHPPVGSGQGQRMPGCKPWGGPRKQGLVGTCLGDPSQGDAWQRGLLPCLPPPAKGGVQPACTRVQRGNRAREPGLGWEEVGRAGPYIGVRCVSPPQVPWYALPSPDTVPPVSQSLQQRDRHPLAPSVAGWLSGGVLTALPTSCGTPHIACSVPGEIQEGSSYGGRGMGAGVMLCEGPPCALRALPKGQKGL